jgi:hypothetical protein
LGKKSKKKPTPSAVRRPLIIIIPKPTAAGVVPVTTRTERNVMRKAFLTLCGLAAGGYAAYAAFRFNVTNATGQDGYVFASVMVMVATGALFLPQLATERWREGAKFEGALWGVGWLTIMLVVLANSAGFTATGRREATASKVDAIRAYDRAQAQYESLTNEFHTMQALPRWTKSAECTNLLADASKSFCQEVKRLRDGISTADRDLKLGRPSESASQVQYELLAGITGKSVAWLGIAVPTITTIILELAALLFMLAAQAAGSLKAVEPETIISPRLRVIPSVREDPAPRLPDSKTKKAMSSIRDRMERMMA